MMKTILILSATALSMLMPACTTVVESPVPAPITEVETTRETRTITNGVDTPMTTTTETRSLRTE